ncbi:intermembrane transport protein PqiB [Halomonas shantousis]
MNDTPRRAIRQRQSRLSPIWIVPLVAVLIGLWMVYDSYSRRGPVITLTMQNAEGIEAGKTLVKSRNVEVGRVAEVELSEDFSHTIATVRMDPDTERMLNDRTRFWVIKPRIDREGISGLGTVLSGAYIQLLPGQSEEPQRHFEVLDHPPVAPPDAAGLRIELVSQLGNSLRTGDPVTYQGYTVGRVESTEFNPETREMRHQLYIQSPYDVLVTDTTRFWTASGFGLRLDSEGFRLNVESFETLLSGGVTFGVPEDVVMGQPVTAGETFTLYADEESARQGTYNRYIEYVLLVDDTVRGLSRGAPVEYRGVRVGTVVSVPWHFTAPQPDSRQRFAIPVLIHLEPQRLEDGKMDYSLEQWRARIDRMFEHGLRATLKTGNLLTQALYVDLNFVQDAPNYNAETFEGKAIFPTTSGGLAQIQQQVTELLEKINGLQIEPILDRLNGNLQASQATLEEVQDTAASINALLNDPALKDMPRSLNDTIEELRSTLEGFSADSQGYQELVNTLSSLETLLRDLQPVARTLSEQPNALIFDKRSSEDPLPRAPR